MERKPLCSITVNFSFVWDLKDESGKLNEPQKHNTTLDIWFSLIFEWTKPAIYAASGWGTKMSTVYVVCKSTFDYWLFITLQTSHFWRFSYFNLQRFSTHHSEILIPMIKSPCLILSIFDTKYILFFVSFFLFLFLFQRQRRL